MRITFFFFALALAPWRAFADPPQVQAVLNAASYQPVIASSTWIAIFGTNLAGATRPWNQSDLAGNLLPIALDGVSVEINGKPGFVSYISPTQINVLSPDDDAEGLVPVRVSTAGRPQ